MSAASARLLPPDTPGQGTVEVHHLPGNHQACVTRHVAALATKMRPYPA